MCPEAEAERPRVGHRGLGHRGREVLGHQQRLGSAGHQYSTVQYSTVQSDVSAGSDLVAGSPRVAGVNVGEGSGDPVGGEAGVVALRPRVRVVAAAALEVDM